MYTYIHITYLHVTLVTPQNLYHVILLSSIRLSLFLSLRIRRISIIPVSETEAHYCLTKEEKKEEQKIEA